METSKTSDVRTRIEPDLKTAAEQILADCGLSMSDAIRLFLRQVVAQPRNAIFDKSHSAQNAFRSRKNSR